MSLLSTRISNTFAMPLPAGANCKGLLVKIHPMEWMEKPSEIPSAGLIIGRDDACDLKLLDDSVSRRHARLRYEGPMICVDDLDSTNGVFVNEQRVHGSKSLEAGDRIRFGNQIFKLVTEEGFELQYHEVIYKMMTTDALTQVYNRRFFLDSLERELQQSQRGLQSFALLLLDLDRFKSINDQHGHLAGDRVLCEFARRARSVLRSGEILARYGGEEFALLCVPADEEQAAAVGERIRAAVAATPVDFESIEIPVTVSIGVACYHSVDTCDSATLIQQADEQLYRAKENGRDQVCVRSAAPSPVRFQTSIQESI
ncbi:putative diguanylate cyclase YdaM [Pirellula sp. SH-Sr6A]|uniref:GGDEF domain-containing protein n=1 Tax=Pirellula sp. SH-Sr6A TaxID=1632865 RepID=UPI00078C88D0|nr:GGDEF domain-containing protein [Pirellula sp. SH-Sr6A]AMV33668.1 putative diguanylate cyclase YdaM [Pirellula sp. SH-Sr6A]